MCGGMKIAAEGKVRGGAWMMFERENVILEERASNERSRSRSSSSSNE